MGGKPWTHVWQDGWLAMVSDFRFSSCIEMRCRELRPQQKHRSVVFGNNCFISSLTVSTADGACYGVRWCNVATSGKPYTHTLLASHQRANQSVGRKNPMTRHRIPQLDEITVEGRQDEAPATLVPETDRIPRTKHGKW